MKITAEFREKFQKLLVSQKGIFSSDDLWTIISPSSNVDFYRQIKKLTNEKMIFKVSRGFYVGAEFSIEALISTIKPDSYLSLEYALAKYNMIGTYTEKKIRPILPVSTKNIVCDKIFIDFKKISKDLFFGIQIKDGIKIATKEKAFLDTLYLYQKGTKFYFDIYSDIDLDQLDRKIIHDYLLKYKNPKFVKFVNEFFHD